MVALPEMKEIDRWALHRLQEVIKRVRTAYDEYQYHVVYYTLHNFCTVDLSALYLDVLKDRLYTSRAASNERHSAQTAMYLILDAMARLIAPILTFTAEEIWEHLPSSRGKADSVHMASFPEVDASRVDEALNERWKSLITLRGEVSKAIEAVRQKKIVGHSLDCRVDIAAPEKLRTLLGAYRDELASLFIVSQVSLASDRRGFDNPYESAEIEGLTVGIARAGGGKCERCWNFSETVGADTTHPAICERCRTNL
jgi:isoleucyl-tRNA synthetase